MNKRNKINRNKRITGQKCFAMLLGLVLGAACGVLMAIYAGKSEAAEKEMDSMLWNLLLLFAGIYLSLLVQIIIHEAGHLIFGLLSGYRFCSFRIFNFMWIKEDNRLQLKRMSLAGTGGQCLMCPPDLKDGRIPYMLYNFGGSIMNLLTGAVFFALHLLCGKFYYLSVFFMMLALMGVLSAVMNGVPMHMGTIDNDGYNALSLGRSEEAVYDFWLQMKVNEQISKGVRLKDMPEAWFAVPDEEAMKNGITAVRGVLACNWLMDMGRFQEAKQLIHRLLEADTAIVELHRGLMRCDEIYCTAVGADGLRQAGEDAEAQSVSGQIKRMMDKKQIKFMKSMKNFPSVLRTEYVYALFGEQDAEKAAKIRRQFEKVSRRYPYQSDVDSDRSLMQTAEDIFRTFSYDTHA